MRRRPNQGAYSEIELGVSLYSRSALHLIAAGTRTSRQVRVAPFASSPRFLLRVRSSLNRRRDIATPISRIDLATEGSVPGIDAETFTKRGAKRNCPVSKALQAVEITLTTDAQSGGWDNASLTVRHPDFARNP